MHLIVTLELFHSEQLQNILSYCANDNNNTKRNEMNMNTKDFGNDSIALIDSIEFSSGQCNAWVSMNV